MQRFEALADDVLKSVQGYVSRALDTFSKRVDELSRYVGDVEKAAKVPGPKGEKGDRGDTGDKGADGVSIIGPAGPAGPKGDPGPKGDKGDAGSSGEPGKNGESVHPDTVALMVREMVEKAVAAIPRAVDGKDGTPGRNASEIIAVPDIAPDKSYPQGTFATCYGGMLFAIRDTDPAHAGTKQKDLEAAGWRVTMNGIYKETEETVGRITKRTTIYTNGKEMVRETKSTAPHYYGVWREGAYEQGDLVTFGGSVFHCERDTTDKPETSDAWKLAVKRGRDGK